MQACSTDAAMQDVTEAGSSVRREHRQEFLSAAATNWRHEEHTHICGKKWVNEAAGASTMLGVWVPAMRAAMHPCPPVP